MVCVSPLFPSLQGLVTHTFHRYQSRFNLFYFFPWSLPKHFSLLRLLFPERCLDDPGGTVDPAGVDVSPGRQSSAIVHRFPKRVSLRFPVFGDVPLIPTRPVLHLYTNKQTYGSLRNTLKETKASFLYPRSQSVGTNSGRRREWVTQRNSFSEVERPRV